MMYVPWTWLGSYMLWCYGGKRPPETHITIKKFHDAIIWC